MNKKAVIEKLEKELGYSNEDCLKIDEIIERNFIIGKKNKEKTINSLKEELNYSEEEAEHIYEVFMSVLTNEVKDKIIHPFKDKDK